MSLFGKSASNKITVAPSSQVDALLKQIVANAQNMQNNDQGFISQQLAGFNGNQQGALNNLAASTTQKQLADMYTPRTQQGLDQLNSLAQQYQNIVNGGGLTADGVNNFSKGLNNSALAQATNKAASNVSLGNGSDSGSLRRAAAQGAALNRSNTNLSRTINRKNMGISAI